jgi:predicted nucleic acid-binding protein
LVQNEVQIQHASTPSSTCFLATFASLPFDDVSAYHCGTIRQQLELLGQVIGPHDLQIAAIAQQH